MRLKYIGVKPTTFRDAMLPNGAMARVGYLQPGQEFGVPDEVAERFTRRADIVEVTGPQDASPTDDAKPGKGRAKAPAEAPVADAPSKPSEAAETQSPAAE
jgi:hypothetical protein